MESEIMDNIAVHYIRIPSEIEKEFEDFLNQYEDVDFRLVSRDDVNGSQTNFYHTNIDEQLAMRLKLSFPILVSRPYFMITNRV